MTTQEAYSAIHPCTKCHGKPVLRYDPGRSYTYCPMREPDCPCLEMSPDSELELLVDRVNFKNCTT